MFVLHYSETAGELEAPDHFGGCQNALGPDFGTRQGRINNSCYFILVIARFRGGWTLEGLFLEGGALEDVTARGQQHHIASL